MKNLLRTIFAPILNYFESGDGEYAYRKSHRKILLVVGGLFLFLTACISVAGFSFAQAGAILPAVIFFSLGVTCIVVGSLGSDRAVAKIWGNL